MTTLEKDALLYAKTGKTEKLAQCLLNGISANFEGLLYYAAERGHLETVELLLGHGADPNSDAHKDSNHNTSLHCAAYSGHVKIVQRLLEHGADPNAKNDEKGTPLGYAQERNHIEVVRLLEAVSSTKISYSIDEALGIEDPCVAYNTLYKAMVNDWSRGYSAAENRFLSLNAFSTFGWPNGIDDMLWQGGLWSITSGIELFDLIEEPVCAGFLRDGLAVIREESERSGLQMTPDLGQRLKFEPPSMERLQALSTKLWDSGDEGYDQDRVFRKTMNYVAQNRRLFTNP